MFVLPQQYPYRVNMRNKLFIYLFISNILVDIQLIIQRTAQVWHQYIGNFKRMLKKKKLKPVDFADVVLEINDHSKALFGL